MNGEMFNQYIRQRQVLFWGYKHITFGEMAGQIPLNVSVPEPELDPPAEPEPDPLPALNASFSTSETEGQGSLTAVFTAEDQADVLYFWDFGDGSDLDTTSGHQVQHTFSSEGNYTVILTVTRNEESAQTNQEVIVWPTPDYSKAIVCTSDGGDSGLVNTITGIFPEATAIYRQESLYSSIIYAKENGYGVICRPTTGLSDYRIGNEGVLAAAWNIIVIHAHGSNSHIELSNPSYIGDIWAVRDNDGSFGSGVEFTIPDVSTESAACAAIAGWVAKLMATYSPSIGPLRTLFRSLASNGGVHQDSNGYGTVDFAAVETALNS